jgi:hypothetical protein
MMKKYVLEIVDTEKISLWFNLYHNLLDNGYQAVVYTRNPFTRYICTKHRVAFTAQHRDIAPDDVIVMWNGNLSTCQSLPHTKVYLENGYFPNTIQIDNQGVNMNASFNVDYDNFLSINRTPPVKNMHITLHTYALSTADMCMAGILAPDMHRWKRYISTLYSRIYRKRVSPDPIGLPDKFIFIPFQVHDDTQIVYNSRHIKKMDEIFTSFFSSIREICPGHQVVAKEHPMDLGRQNYTRLRKSYPDILWLRNYDINELIDKCSCVITINSSVGFQALARYKRVLTLGDSFYDKNPFVEHMRSTDEFEEKLEKLIKKTIDTNAVDSYISHFKDLFIPGGLSHITEDTIRGIIGYLEAI